MWGHHLPPWVPPLIDRATTNVITEVERVGQKVAATIVPKIMESNTNIGQKLDDKTAAMVRANFEASEQVVKQLSAQMARGNSDIADRIVQSLLARPEIIAALRDGGGGTSGIGVSEEKLREIVGTVAQEERQQLKILAKGIEVMVNDIKEMQPNQLESMVDISPKLEEIDGNVKNIVKEISAEVGEQASLTFVELERLNDNLESLNAMVQNIATAEARYVDTLQRLEISIQEIKAEQTELLGEIKDSSTGSGSRDNGRPFKEEFQDGTSRVVVVEQGALNDIQRSVNLLKSYIYILSSAALVGIVLLVHNINATHQLSDFTQDVDSSLHYVASSLGRQSAALAHNTEAVESLDQSVKAKPVNSEDNSDKKKKLFDDNWSYWTMTGVLIAWSVWLVDEYLCGGKWTWVKNIEPPTLDNIPSSAAASDAGGGVVDAVGDAAVSLADTELSPDWSIQ